VKKLLLFLLISVGLNAQFNYQAIVKDSDGNPVTNNQVKFKFSLMYQSSTASPVYVEEHELVTPPDGVVNLSVGGGTVVNGTLSDIDWSQSVFMKEELDKGSGYQDMGTRKVASVPVAEYAKRVAGLNTISSTITLDSNISTFNTTAVISATSFKGNATELTITESGTVLSLIEVINELKSKIEKLEQCVSTCSDTNVLVDHENNEYEYVEICDKLWTTSYLKTTTYKNGTFINNPLYTSSLGEECITRGNCSCELTSPFDEVAENQIPTYVYPSTFGGHFQMIDYKDKWGLHYNKWIVDNISDIIPEGWEIPSSQDFIDMFECLGGVKLTNTSGDKWNNLDGLRSNEVVDWDEYENIEGQCNQYYTGNVGWKTGMQGTNSSGLNLIPSGYSYRSNIGISKLIGSHDAVLLTSDYKLVI
jgi:uncharacterized protein (TIGR02145 family)